MQGGVDAPQGPLPGEWIGDLLGGVRGHRREVDPEGRQVRRVTVDPANAFGTGLRTGDIEGRQGRVDADHLGPPARQRQREHTGATAEVEDTAGT